MSYFKRDMLSINTRKHLTYIIQQTILLVQSLESFKQSLANINHFDCVTLFRSFDHTQKGYLILQDFTQFMGHQNKKLLTYAFSWIDVLKVGQISRLQFAAFILPRENSELRELIAERMQHPTISQRSQQTLPEQFSIFREMLVHIIESEIKLINLRRKLLKCDDYSFKGVMYCLNNQKNDWVTIENMYSLMKNYGYNVSLEQLKQLTISMNQNLNGRLTQKQLLWCVQGLEGSNKQYRKKIKKANKGIKNKNSRQNRHQRNNIQLQQNLKYAGKGDNVQNEREQNNEYKKLIQSMQSAYVRLSAILQEKDAKLQLYDCEMAQRSKGQLEQKLQLLKQKKDIQCSKQNQQIKTIEKEKEKFKQEKQRYKQQQQKYRKQLKQLQNNQQISKQKQHRVQEMSKNIFKNDQIIQSQKPHSVQWEQFIREQQHLKRAQALMQQQLYRHIRFMEEKRKQQISYERFNGFSSNQNILSMKQLFNCRKSYIQHLQNSERALMRSQSLRQMLKDERRKKDLSKPISIPIPPQMAHQCRINSNAVGNSYISPYKIYQSHILPMSNSTQHTVLNSG